MAVAINGVNVAWDWTRSLMPSFPAPKQHEQQLDSEAQAIIASQLADGYTEGELFTFLGTGQDGDGIQYVGNWQRVGK